MSKNAYFSDIIGALRYRELILYRAGNEIKLRYKRTLIGPLWTTLSMAIFIVSFGLVGSKLWHTDVATFMPFFCSGFLAWALISTIITDSRNVFLANKEILGSTAIPIHIFVLDLILKNYLVFLHHLIVYAGVLLFFSYAVGWNLLLILPGLAIIFLTSVAFVLIWGIACTRYHDLGQLSGNLLQIIFFLTPIMWPESTLRGTKIQLLVEFNPMYYFVNLIRAPMLGEAPPLYSYAVTSAICLSLLALAAWMFRRYRHRIIFWL